MRYQLTAHNGRRRSFLSKWYTTYDWLEYSPIVDKMYCFVCRCFAHRVIGSVGRIDAAFTSSRTQAKRWKNARSVLSKHQSSSIHKQAALCWVDFLAVKPISQQLCREVEASASRKKMHQERNRQILYQIIMRRSRWCTLLAHLYLSYATMIENLQFLQRSSHCCHNCHRQSTLIVPVAPPNPFPSCFSLIEAAAYADVACNIPQGILFIVW